MSLIQHSVKDHRYYTDGKRFYPSPTTVLKLYFGPMFKKWSQNKDNLEYRNQRMIVGSRIHSIVNSEILHTPYESNPMDDHFDIKQMSRMVKDYLLQSEIILSEAQVVNDKIRIAGTLDYVTKDVQGFSLIDLKTVDNEKKVKSKQVLKGHFMQLAAYHAGLKQCHPEITINRWICLIASPTDLKIQEVSRLDMAPYMKDFLTLRNQYLTAYGR